MWLISMKLKIEKQSKQNRCDFMCTLCGKCWKWIIATIEYRRVWPSQPATQTGMMSYSIYFSLSLHHTHVDRIFTTTENLFFKMLVKWVFPWCHYVNNNVPNDRLKIDRMNGIGKLKENTFKIKTNRLYKQNPIWNEWKVLVKL